MHKSFRARTDAEDWLAEEGAGDGDSRAAQGHGQANARGGHTGGNDRRHHGGGGGGYGSSHRAIDNGGGQPHGDPVARSQHMVQELAEGVSYACALLLRDFPGLGRSRDRHTLVRHDICLCI